MSQKSITSFFCLKPSGNLNSQNMKRSQVVADGESAIVQKKQKIGSKSNPLQTSSVTCPQDSIQLNQEIQKAIVAQCKLTPLLHPSIEESWFTALKEKFAEPFFGHLSEFVCSERTKGPVHPSPKDVFSWTRYTPIDQVKVVIIGQDPYHGPAQAHGLCFSVMAGIPPPPSLKNIYKELSSDIEGFKAPGHGYLLGWALQGVLMLNAVLTVRQHSANSHKKKGWEKLTDAVIQKVSETNKGVVFLLWGKDAQKFAACIKNKEDHHILQTVHPSPLSASRGFLGCKHFSRCNQLLVASGKTAIDWTRLPL